MLPATACRVPANTAERVNERIRRQTEENVRRLADSHPEEIERRLRELDSEWDIERCLETMAPSITLLGIGLSLTVSRKFLLLPVAVQAFFLQHALQGWCPPMPILRRMGVRTAAEINHERNALKALRGDYVGLPKGEPEAALRAAR